MARPSIFHDPETVEKIVEYLAMGMPIVTVADAFGVARETLHRWLKRKTFRNVLAAKQLEMAADPVKKVRDTMPLAWLERHPEFRQQFAPPGKDEPLTAKIIVEVIGQSTGGLKVEVDG